MFGTTSSVKEFQNETVVNGQTVFVGAGSMIFLATILLAIIGIQALGTANCNAQPLGITHHTIEARLAQAETVILAEILDLSRNVLVEQGGKHPDGWTDPNGRDQYTVNLKVKEVFKGDIGEVASDLQPVSTVGFDKRFDQWKEAGTRFLCFLGPDPQAGEKRTWTYLPLGEQLEAEKIFGRDNKAAPMLTQDLKVLKTEDEVIERAREYGRISDQEKLPGCPVTIGLRIPNLALLDMPGADYNTVVLPVNAALEKLAHRLINSPQEFFPEKNPLPNDWPHWPQQKSSTRYLLKSVGIRCIRYFKSDPNVTLLTELMKEDPKVFGVGPGFKPIRLQAMEVLLGWQTRLVLPEFCDSITELDLSDSNANDQTLTLVGQFSNLDTLNLTGTRITSDGLRHLRGLARMTLIKLSIDQLTDDNVRVLNEIGILHAVSDPIMTPVDGVERPGSPADVRSLTFWGSRLTDAGLQEFSRFENVIYVDLRNTSISDAGLDALSQMTRLKYLHIDNTEVTDSGIDRLLRFRELEGLGLENLPITDAALEKLSRAGGLRYLRLGGTKITGEGIARLKKALPDCTIVFP